MESGHFMCEFVGQESKGLERWGRAAESTSSSCADSLLISGSPSQSWPFCTPNNDKRRFLGSPLYLPVPAFYSKCSAIYVTASLHGCSYPTQEVHDAIVKIRLWSMHHRAMVHAHVPSRAPRSLSACTERVPGREGSGES